MNFITKYLEKRQQEKIAKRDKNLQDLRHFFETEDNEGLLWRKLAYHPSVNRATKTSSHFITVDVTMNDGYYIDGYDILISGDAIRAAGLKLVNRLEELNK